MKNICFTVILCVLVLCPFQAAYSDTPYILFNIDVTGAVETVAMDINNHGKIVGYYKDPTGYVFGFLRHGEVVVPFAYPGSEYTYAMGINDVDWVVGNYYDDVLFSWGNFLHNGSDFVPVYPPCGEGFNYVNDINNTYWMVGNCGNGDVGFMQSGANHALFSFPGAPYTFAFGMNDNYLIAGCDHNTSYFGTVLDGFYPFQVPGAQLTWAYGVNNAALIAGTYKYANKDYGFVRETSGKIASIHMPGAAGTIVYGINDHRQLVGTYKDASNIIHAFAAVPAPNPLPADLVVSEIVTDPADPEPGEQFEVYITVENQGAYDAGGFFLDWYANESSAPSPPPFGNRREYVPGLAAGATYTMSTTWTYAASGVYQMYGYADEGYGVYESNESNNVLGPAEIVVNPFPADLIVSNIVTDPADPEPGEQFEVYITVENQGAYDAGGFFLDWYANESSAPSPPPFGNRREYVPSLAVGATYTMSTTWTYAASGVYQMYAYADTEYGVYESNETNNIMGPVEIVVGAYKAMPWLLLLLGN